MIERWLKQLEGTLDAAPTVLLTLLLAAFLLWLINRFAAAITTPKEFSRRNVRTETLRVVLTSSLRVLVLVFTLVAILSELGINVTALLAGVSVLGLAVSFGAQSMVRDVLSGFFILLEDQYGVGDVIKVNAASAHVLAGSVESLNLRVTVLRDLEGTAHIIPNGEIKTVSVLSKDWARIVADVDVPNTVPVETAMRELQNLVKTFADEANCKNKFLEPPEVLGVQALGHQTTIRVLMKVLPKEQWALSREWRKHLRNRLDELAWQAPPANPPVIVQLVTEPTRSETRG
ncbi:MAG: mechanosensitive ion channel family protein [Deinococcales bacterium]